MSLCSVSVVYTMQRPCVLYLNSFNVFVKLVIAACTIYFKKCLKIQSGASWPWETGGLTLNFFEVVGFLEISMLRRKIFGLLLLAKIKVSNFIGKSLNSATLL